MQNAIKGEVLSKTNATVRWAVNVKDWIPTEKQWTKAINSVQVDEQERINRFRYRLDAKASLIGRLLMRFWAMKTFQIENDAIIFDRSDRGRPRLLLNDGKSWIFNVSHAGDYTVFTAQKNVEFLGVDIMRRQDPRFEEKDSKICEFFRLMKRQFTTEEWSQICDENLKLSEQAENFFRFWTLKESFVKAIGHGLGFNLQRLSFFIHSPLQVHSLTKDTVLFVDEVKQENWNFEETLLDSEHCVCIATKMCQELESPTTENLSDKDKFSLLTCETLLSDMKPLTKSSDEVWSNFCQKIDKKPF